MGLTERANTPAGVFRGEDRELLLAGGQAAGSEACIGGPPQALLSLCCSEPPSRGAGPGMVQEA